MNDTRENDAKKAHAEKTRREVAKYIAKLTSSQAKEENIAYKIYLTMRSTWPVCLSWAKTLDPLYEIRIVLLVARKPSKRADTVSELFTKSPIRSLAISTGCV